MRWFHFRRGRSRRPALAAPILGDWRGAGHGVRRPAAFAGSWIGAPCAGAVLAHFVGTVVSSNCSTCEMPCMSWVRQHWQALQRVELGSSLAERRRTFSNRASVLNTPAQSRSCTVCASGAASGRCTPRCRSAWNELLSAAAALLLFHGRGKASARGRLRGLDGRLGGGTSRIS